MIPQFAAASDRSLLVSLGSGISLDTHRRVLALSRAVQTDPIPGVLNIHPAYCSVLVVFDPLLSTHDAVCAAVIERWDRASHASLPETRVVEVPVRYGGSDGPDLDDVASAHGLTADRVVELHSSAQYVAAFVGFVPAFAYLAGLPPELATPRLSTPRPSVPAGSVGIAGAQTGVYPFATPGGWRLIGRTPLLMFDASRTPMSLIEIGDRVRFVRVSEHA